METSIAYYGHRFTQQGDYVSVTPAFGPKGTGRLLEGLNIKGVERIFKMVVTEEDFFDMLDYFVCE